MPAIKSFFELIKERNEILWAPCIYDCISAKCAEAVGFEAVTISSMEQTMSLTGVPLGMMSFDEMLFSAERIAKSTTMAVLADTEDGGPTPMDVYRNIKRFAEAGIMAVSIEDTDCRKLGNKPMADQMFLPAEHWAANVAAAVEAVKGTDCMVIARTDCKGGGSKKSAKGYFGVKPEEFLGLEEAIRRAQLGMKMGAHMTMIQNIDVYTARNEWLEISKRVPGWMCYPDLHADDGISDVEDVKELYDLGFQMVTCHCFAKGAVAGMLKYGNHVIKDRNTIFTENDDSLGADPKQVAHVYRRGEGERHPFDLIGDKLAEKYESAFNYKASNERVR